MKTLKYVIASVIILGLIFVGFGYMQESQVSVSRSVIIPAPISDVFDQFNDLEKRLKWSPWEAADSTMITTIGDVSKGVGASYSWTSENSGDGTISYKEVVENQLIESVLQFGEEDPAQGLIIFSGVADGTKVTWEVHMDMGNNPFARLMGRYMDDMVGPTFEDGLQSVKEICESNIAEQAQALIDNYADVSISEIVVESKPCISILDSCYLDEIGERFERHYGDLGAFVGKNKLQITGFSRAIYHLWEPPTKVVFEPLFVLDKSAESTLSNIKVGTTYAGKVITATHIGSYEKSAHVWEALDNYIKNHNLEMNGSPWEQYENTPRDEPDPNKYITHIFMPVK